MSARWTLFFFEFHTAAFGLSAPDNDLKDALTVVRQSRRNTHSRRVCGSLFAPPDARTRSGTMSGCEHRLATVWPVSWSRVRLCRPLPLVHLLALPCSVYLLSFRFSVDGADFKPPIGTRHGASNRSWPGRWTYPTTSTLQT